MKNYFKKAIMTLIIAVMGISMVGCGTVSPTDYIKANLEDVKSGNYQEFKEQLAVEEGAEVTAENFSNEGLLKVFAKLKDIEYTINSETDNGDTATVNVTVKGPDLGKLFEDAIKQMTQSIMTDELSGSSKTEADYLNEYKQVYSTLADNIDIKENTMDINLSKDKDGNWTFTNEEEFIQLVLNFDANAFSEDAQ